MGKLCSKMLNVVQGEKNHVRLDLNTDYINNIADLEKTTTSWKIFLLVDYITRQTVIQVQGTTQHYTNTYLFIEILQTTNATSNYMRVEKYNERNWAVYDTNEELICITVYKKGALEVARRSAEKLDFFMP